VSGDLAAALQRTLGESIPLARAMGVRVLEASGTRVRLGLPLEPNHNHKDTAFGGSLYSAAVLAGWSLLWCGLRERGVEAHVVIASSAERFRAPAEGDFISECAAEPGVLDAALGALKRKGRARVRLACAVSAGGTACLEFDGVYGLLAG